MLAAIIVLIGCAIASYAVMFYSSAPDPYDGDDEDINDNQP